MSCIYIHTQDYTLVSDHVKTILLKSSELDKQTTNQSSVGGIRNWASFDRLDLLRQDVSINLTKRIYFLTSFLTQTHEES